MTMKFTTIIPILLLALVDIGYKPNPVPKKMHDFIVIAHRGDHTVYPENTLEGYAMAAKNEADYVEIDLRTTSDNQLVSMHDGSVNRMTNGKGLIKDLTLQQIEALKVNARSSTDTATYRVPTFEQILKLCRNKIHIYIDFKEADATATLTMLKQYHMEKQVLVYINKPSQYTDWRKTDPSMPLMLSLPDSVKSTVSLQSFLNKYQPDVLDGDYSDYTTDMVALAKAGGLQVWPDAQGPKEGPAVWDKAISIGLTGLQTDNPHALVQYLKSKGLR
ncbi:glycerophosphodiester phosphodiesterase family protein [Mucilaginibacter sp.]|uniref:glycerophosphodiester phosphodiesterase n=1 Tax=Mucilaginibacter sp. TaxID=1882438 RepID=UPI00283FE0CC|nr:glycerophosphodiester phosphodiesterase family protein [Mucilaginibacter sp.]MDR3695363.1 glycerophosphodiester phosphodiesterase family protein [Mucilaginibacter sp.]